MDDPLPLAPETGRRIVLVTGLALAVVALAQPALAWLVEPAWGFGLGATMATELVTGRETAIPLALDQGVPPAWIALTSLLQNLAMAALLVPLVVAAMRQAEHGQGRMAYLLRRIHQSAEEQRHKAASAWGIFLFMLVPFLANGPIIAGLIGRLVGVESRRLVVAIVAAVIITAAAWSFAYAALTQTLAAVDARLARVPAILALCIAILAIIRLAWAMRVRPPA